MDIQIIGSMLSREYDKAVILSLMVTDWIARKATQRHLVGVWWNNDERLTELDFAADTARLGESRNNLQNLTTQTEV